MAVLHSAMQITQVAAWTGLGCFVQEEQITRNILASWQVQRSMHSEVKKVLEVAKRKKRNERVVRLVDAAARGDVSEVAGPLTSPVLHPPPFPPTPGFAAPSSLLLSRP